MNFTHPCFVRAENFEERQELIQWLIKIGYDTVEGFPNPRGASNRKIIRCKNDRLFRTPACDAKLLCVGIYCGTNTDYFKALAAINDENDYMQWFITNKGEWFVSAYDKQFLFEHKRTIDGVVVGVRSVRKATPEELEQFFNDKTE